MQSNKDQVHYYNLKRNARNSINSVLLTINREHKKVSRNQYPHQMQSLQGFIKSLSYYKELEGHVGCVNCIEFNEDGSYLISGSDDTKLILWDAIHERKRKLVHTGHRGNIFSVKFLPKTADNYVVSGAGDCHIELTNILSEETVSHCHCHKERVKRIATLPLSSDVYFSASEDGTIRQFDRREKHPCSPQTSNILLDLRHLSDVKLEAKCLAINPIRTELIAVGATDGYIRAYDRRKLTLTSLDTLSKQTQFSPLPNDCVQYYTPGHLPDKMANLNNKLYKTLATTYLTFSSNGRHLLANMGGDNVYLFNTMTAQISKNYSIPPHQGRERENFEGSRISINSRSYQHKCKNSKDTLNFESLGYLFEDGPQTNWYPPEVSSLISAADSLPRRDELIVLELLNKAIDLWPYSAKLYVHRASVYVNRNWDGDLYSALRDCERALQVQPSCRMALYTKITCLHYMKKDEEALYALEADEDIMNRLTAREGPLIALYEFLSKSRDFRFKSDKTAEKYCFVKMQRSELLSEDEEAYRSRAKDYERTYNGHCNTTTDIKEANFIGSECEYIAAGSDDGNLFIWDRNTTNLVHVLKADQSIVNCVQFHPTSCMLATSGMEAVIKLWTPNKLRVEPTQNISSIQRDNQLRMGQDPMEVMMFPVNEMNIGTHIADLAGDNSSDEDEADYMPIISDPNTQPPCRTS